MISKKQFDAERRKQRTDNYDFDIVMMELMTKTTIENAVFLRLYDWDSAKRQKELLVNIAKILLKENFLSEYEFSDVSQHANTSIPEGYVPYTFAMLATKSHGVQKILELMSLNHVVIHGIGVECHSPVDGLLKNLSKLDKTSARSILSLIVEGLKTYGWLTQKEADRALEGFHPIDEDYEVNFGVKKVFNLVHSGRVRIFFGNSKLVLSFEGDENPDSNTRYFGYVERMKELGLLTEDISIRQDLSPVHKKMQN